MNIALSRSKQDRAPFSIPEVENAISLDAHLRVLTDVLDLAQSRAPNADAREFLRAAAANTHDARNACRREVARHAR